MGMDLSGVGGYFRVSYGNWCDLLELAYKNGWKPAGTQPGRWYDQNGEIVKQMSPDPDEWNGSYFCNAFQWVTKEDAANIADALERALDAKPDFTIVEVKYRVEDMFSDLELIDSASDEALT